MRFDSVAISAASPTNSRRIDSRSPGSSRQKEESKLIGPLYEDLNIVQCAACREIRYFAN